MDKEAAELAKFYAREASRRVKSSKAKERALQEEAQRRHLEYKLALHGPKPRRRHSVPENEEAARFSAEQQILHQERLNKKLRNRQEWEELQHRQMETELEQLVEHRRRLKELHLQKIRSKKEEQQQTFIRNEDHLRAAQRAAQFLRRHPELQRNSSAPRVTGKPRTAVLNMPGTKEAVARVKDFRKREEEKRRRQEQVLEEGKKKKHALHKENMVKVRQNRAKSCPRNSSKSNWSLDSSSLDRKLREIKNQINSLKNRAI
jgi:hypothetical protein